MSDFDCFYASQPLVDLPDANGDMGFFTMKDDKIFLALLDVLGHGKEAYKVGQVARAFLCRCDEFNNMADLMQDLHEALRGTRGAVAALCLVDLKSGRLTYSGIGNIAVKVMGPRPFTMIPRDGIIGYMIPTPKELEHKLFPGDILVMYSDGIKAHFDQFEYAGLLEGTAESICSRMISQFGKQDDDASCLVLKMMI
ncbi:MAG: serine/threonine-protein phosphatase [Firmicutes bacterium]|nr:serine/threonine-protein phosphatase [Bacillota bacterium]